MITPIIPMIHSHQTNQKLKPISNCKVCQWIVSDLTNNIKIYSDICKFVLPTCEYAITFNKSDITILNNSGVRLFILHLNTLNSIIYNFKSIDNKYTTQLIKDTLLNYDYIVSYLRDNKLNTLLNG